MPSARWVLGCAPSRLRPVEASGNADVEGGVSSFGYNGTIAHAVLGACRRSRDELRGPPLRWRRGSFYWRECMHPLLQERSPRAASVVAVFHSPAAGALRSLVADHVVQGRIVFPGAGYLEMARAACSALAGVRSPTVRLARAHFVQPLLLSEDLDGLRIQCVVLSEADGRLEVRSIVDDALQEESQLPTDDAGAATVHFSAAAVVAVRASERLRVQLQSARGHAVRAQCSRALYDAFHRSGLEYGPSHRSLAEAWRTHADARLAVARLWSRRDMRGTRVHPADVDGMLQLPMAIRAPTTEPWLPFAIDGATLAEGGRNLWPVRGLSLRRSPACSARQRTHADARVGARSSA